MQWVHRGIGSGAGYATSVRFRGSLRLRRETARVGARRLCGDVWGTAWGPGPGPRAVLPRLRLGSTAVGDRLNFDL